MNPPNKSTTVFPQTEEIPVPLEIHPSVSPLAAELLMKVAEMIASEPKCYDQGYSAPLACDTACCLLGNMRIAAKMRPTNYQNTPEECDVLGLRREQAFNLYVLDNWPDAVRPDRKMHDVTAQEGIARIEHFLRTGQ